MYLDEKNKKLYGPVMDSVFSDETELFRSPSEPDPGDSVLLKIRLKKNVAKRVTMIVEDNNLALLMKKIGTDELFDWFETGIVCTDKSFVYYFIIELDDKRILYDKTGASLLEEGEAAFSFAKFRFTPGFHVPQWAKGSIEYQIFTDRFYNGNDANDVVDNEYYYTVGHSMHVKNWDAFPTEQDIRCFYGGDLSGILVKLDYLQWLGVETLYLNPIFISPSSHKYDTQDYEHVDPHFGVISEDMDHRMQDWEMHNGYAPRYIKRVTSEENLRKSDELFAYLCTEIHRRGMKIILDGVFNHCGSFNKWMDKEGIYLGKPGYELGAYQSPDSPYRDFFKFNEEHNKRRAEYEGWWGYDTLPKLNYEKSEVLREKIYSIAEKWASPPYSIDGWRLDVAADLGHSEEFNHQFWKEFRRRLKKINPDLLILAEHYGDASPWLQGDEWDTVMNYDAFMEPLTYFLTGMEKHSDSRREDLCWDGEAFFLTMMSKMAAFEYPSLVCAMNELSNHDHSRFMTRTNGRIGRLETAGPLAAAEGIRPEVFRQAVVIQMTWPGSPTIYYGDEAGQVGWTDPDSRRTYPWKHENAELIELHRELILLRKELPVLKTGSLKPLSAGQGIIAYARFDEKRCVVIACNCLSESIKIDIPVINAGIRDGSIFSEMMSTGRAGHDYKSGITASVKNGALCVKLPECSSIILAAGEEE